MFDGPAPRVFTIASGLPFARVLAEGVSARLDLSDPLALARVTLYAPTRRGARTLTDAFVDLAGGKPILAPRIMTLADLDDPMGLGADLPEAISGTERLLTLTRLVRALGQHKPHLAQEATATALARDLMQLLDQVQGEGLTLDALENAAPENHAAHWTETVSFLNILRAAWPAHLAEQGKIDPVARRAELVRRQIAAWEAAPPSDPVIVAGSTGSVGISADLIAAVARLPQGAVILPGLDRDLEATAFRALPAAHPDHPQAGLSRLLARIGGAEGPVPRAGIADWTETAPDPRRAFFSIALRPAPVTDTWLSQQKLIADTAPETLASVDLIEAETSQEEADAIAFAMREAVQDPDRTVALITTDGMLGRRVSAALKRWDIVADDSAGRPLHLTPPGVFLSLLLDEGLSMSGPGDPARLLALLKHPLASLGVARGDHMTFVRRVEIVAMRAGSSGADLDAIRAALTPQPDDETSVAFTKNPAERGKRTADWTQVDAQKDAARTERDAALLSWLDTLADALSPLRSLMIRDEVPLSEIMVALKQSADAVSLNDKGEVPVWEKETGKAALAFINDITTHAPAFGALAPASAPILIGGLMTGSKVRAPYGQHPRVFIWGTLEARMSRADVMILAGLNEDGWPKLPDPDPWMSRAMRADYGLPPLERRIGLSAHDFQQAFCAQRVILSRARKQDGAPTVASRWLQRITTLLGIDEKTGFAPQVLAEMRGRGNRYRSFAAQIARQSEGEACARPHPMPPVDARPRSYSVTEIETLARDPYAVYARRVLRLNELADLTPDPDARDRGNVIHKIVEWVVEATEATWPERAESEALFDAMTERALADYAKWPTVRAFYKARALRIKPWFLDEETARRARGEVPKELEARGDVQLDVPQFGGVDLGGYADRIDRLSDGSYAIYDYKTGAPPSDAQVRTFAQQLPLEGAMLRDGGFKGLPAGAVTKLAHIRLQGGETGGKETALSDVDELIAEALPRLRELLSAYADPARGYLSRARPESIQYAGSYDHLARVGEWESSEGGDT